MAERRRSQKGQVFQYEAYDKKNVRVSGEISARNLNLAKASLKAQGYNIIKIKKKATDLFAIFKGGGVKKEDLTLFTRQLSTLSAAGIPLVQSLGMVADGMVESSMYNIIQKIKIDVESGSTFSIALKKYPRIFDELYCGLMETGEQSGTLDTMLSRIAIYKEKADSLRRKVRKALYYPIAVLVIAAIVTTILLVKVVPTFKEMFVSAGGDLPAFTKMVMKLSEILQEHGLLTLGIIILSIVIFTYAYRRNTTFNHTVQRLSLRIPVFGQILQKTAIARFARTLATTTAAGIPLTEALDAVGRAAGNIVYVNAIQEIKQGLTVGSQMRTMMKKVGIFPQMVVQMVGIGEESGALEDMLSKVATIYEEEVDTQVDGLTTLLEPLIMAILGVVVGGLVVAMYLPIFKMGTLY